MRAAHLAAVTIVLGVASAQAGPREATKLWETAGFKAPESALYDAQSGLLYVSNVNGELTAKDGNGFISKVAPDGKVTTLDWVTGLDGPKGLARVGGKLYAADIDKLVEIDIAAGKIVKRYDATGAKFLNDVAADASGNVYVSDTATNTIWRLSGGKFEIFLKDDKLEGPNGLHVADGALLVAEFGNPADGIARSQGHLKVVSLKDKSIASHGDGLPIGNLDGLEPFGDGAYLVSDWQTGRIIRIGRKGKTRVLAELGQSAADLSYDQATATVFVPNTRTGLLFAYKLE